MLTLCLLKGRVHAQLGQAGRQNTVPGLRSQEAQSLQTESPRTCPVGWLSLSGFGQIVQFLLVPFTNRSSQIFHDWGNFLCGIYHPSF